MTIQDFKFVDGESQYRVGENSVTDFINTKTVDKPGVIKEAFHHAAK